MPIVKMPDGKLVEMPDAPTPEQLAGLQKFLGGKEPEESAFSRYATEIGKVLGKSVYGGVTAIPRLISQGLQSQTGQGLIAAIPFVGPDLASQPEPKAVANEVLATDQKLLKALEPKTSLGKKAANVGEAVVGTFAGPAGNISKLGRLGIGLSSGLGAEAGAAIGGDNALSRTAGGLLGGGLAAGLASATNADKLLRTAVGQVSPSDWRRAKQIQDTLTEAGVPHLPSQLLGDRSTLGDLVAVAATHPTTRPRLLSAVENAPEATRQAFGRWRDQNLPINVDETRSVLSDIQKTAADRISDLKGQANQAYADALPPGVSQQLADPQQVEDILKALRAEAGSSDFFGRLAPGGQFLNSIADRLEAAANGDVPLAVGEINNMLKSLNTVADQAGYKGTALQTARSILREGTPEFQPARDAKAAFSASEVNPAQRGLTGQLAQMGGGVKPDRFTAKNTALTMVFPNDTPQPQAIRELAKQIGGEGVGELLREHLAKAMEKAVKLSNASGREQQPFNFVQSVAGTNAQRQNLEAALTETAKAMGANPFAVRNGFYKMMRAFESFKDLNVPSSVDRTVLSQQAGLNLPGLIVAPQSRIGRALWEKATERTFNRIADMILSRDGLAKLEAIGRGAPPSVLQAYTRGVLTAAQGSTEE